MNNKKRLTVDDVDYVIYHGNCPDGFGAALSIYLYLTNKYPNRDVIYYPAKHGVPPPKNTENRNVVIVDFSYKKKDLLELIKITKNILIIDHHISSEIELIGIDDIYKIFDMKHSGAWLSYKWVFPKKKVPLLIKYIQDRDIWTKKFDDIDAFSSWFQTVPFDFKEYSKYMDDKLLLEMIKNKGKNYLELNEFYTTDLSVYGTPKFIKINDNYYVAVFLNSPILKSDLGNYIISKIFPRADFSAIYSVNDQDYSVTFSLRSTDNHADVSKIATELDKLSNVNGGGHKCASSIKVKGDISISNMFPCKMIDNNGFLYPTLQEIYFEVAIVNKKVYNKVYIDSILYKREIGQYLLQTKYVENVTPLTSIEYTQIGLYLVKLKIIDRYIGSDTCNNKVNSAIIREYDNLCTNNFNNLNEGITSIIKKKYRPVQVCTAIYRTLKRQDDWYKYFTMSSVKSFNGIKTEFVFTFDKTLKKKVIKTINDYFKCDLQKGITINGNNRQLDINIK